MTLKLLKLTSRSFSKKPLRPQSTPSGGKLVAANQLKVVSQFTAASIFNDWKSFYDRLGVGMFAKSSYDK
ncbi:MAG: hypothetical protein ACPGU0_04320 [Marinirhabdus sp.]